MESHASGRELRARVLESPTVRAGRRAERDGVGIQLEVEAFARVPREEAYEWWTDYSETDHDAFHFRPFGWMRREILDRDATGRVTRFRDVGRALGQDTSYESLVSYEPSRAVLEESEGPVGSFVARYGFEDAGGRRGGTRVTMTVAGDVTARWAMPLARLPGFPALLARLDLEGHVHGLRRDLAR